MANFAFSGFSSTATPWPIGHTSPVKPQLTAAFLNMVHGRIKQELRSIFHVIRSNALKLMIGLGHAKNIGFWSDSPNTSAWKLHCNYLTRPLYCDTSHQNEIGFGNLQGKNEDGLSAELLSLNSFS
ncbi:hypothetical protein V6N13_025854 [Hibiscus sabdariffa]